MCMADSLCCRVETNTALKITIPQSNAKKYFLKRETKQNKF